MGDMDDLDDLDKLLQGLEQPHQSTRAPKPKQAETKPASSASYSSSGVDCLDELLDNMGEPASHQQTHSRNTQQPVRNTQQPVRNTQQPIRNTQQPVRNTQSAGQMDDLDELLRNLGPPSATHSPSPAPVQSHAHNAYAPSHHSPSPAPSHQAPHHAQSHDRQTQSYDRPPQAYDRQSHGPISPPPNRNAPRPVQPAATKPAGARVVGGPDLDKLLDDINKTSTRDLDRGGPASRGDCAHCRKPILGEVIQALDRTYHPEHFMCGNCQAPLGTSNFYEQDGAPNCERCYQELFCSRCAHCDEPITGKCITALNRKWHHDHFICAQCLGPFPGGTFFEKEGRPYCENCFHNAFSSRCSGCNQSIRGECINALGQQWHPEHFVCQYCQKSFGSGSFYEYGGKPYCEVHYHQQTGSLCAGCGKAVTGRVINALDKKWHPEHFVCSFCMQPLAGGAFTESAGKAYCKECHGKLFG